MFGPEKLLATEWAKNWVFRSPERNRLEAAALRHPSDFISWCAAKAIAKGMVPADVVWSSVDLVEILGA